MSQWKIPSNIVSYIKVLFLIFHEKVSWFTFLKVISLRGIISYTFFQFIFYCNHLYFLVTIKGIYIVGTWKNDFKIWLHCVQYNISFFLIFLRWKKKSDGCMLVAWVEQDNFLLLLPLKKWLKSLISLTHILMLLYYVCRIYILFYIQNWHRLPCAGPLADLRMKSEDSAKTVEQNKTKNVYFRVNFRHLFRGKQCWKNWKKVCPKICS